MTLLGLRSGRRTTFQGPHTNCLTSYRYKASSFPFFGDVIEERIRPAGIRLLLVMGVRRMELVSKFVAIVVRF